MHVNETHLAIYRVCSLVFSVLCERRPALNVLNFDRNSHALRAVGVLQTSAPWNALAKGSSPKMFVGVSVILHDSSLVVWLPQFDWPLTYVTLNFTRDRDIDVGVVIIVSPVTCCCTWRCGGGWSWRRCGRRRCYHADSSWYPVSRCTQETSRTSGCHSESQRTSFNQTTGLAGDVSSHPNSNSNSYDNVYGAAIVTQPLREFTRFIWRM